MEPVEVFMTRPNRWPVCSTGRRTDDDEFTFAKKLTKLHWNENEKFGYSDNKVSSQKIKMYKLI